MGPVGHHQVGTVRDGLGDLVHPKAAQLLFHRGLGAVLMDGRGVGRLAVGLALQLAAGLALRLPVILA
jgi:hypothetical protein